MSQICAAIFGAEGLRLSAVERRFFAATNPFGFILFARNIDTPEQVRCLTKELRDCVGRDVPILIDQEGGRVQRLRAPHWREWAPPFETISKARSGAAEIMYLRSRIIAHELYDLGIDTNCAPLIDVVSQATHPFLLNRCYASDPAQVAAIGRAVANGLMDGGVLPVVKHIPGHGRAAVDSHFDLPETDADHATLSQEDFAPFKALNDLPMAMTAHVVFNSLDPHPATLSSKVIDLIRAEIGFDGLLMTDDISMKALVGSLAALSAASLSAGCDVILHCNGKMEEMHDVAEASGILAANALERAERVLSARHAPIEVDIAALEAKLEALS